jgi:DNA-binding response OmpR family regulator
MGSLAAAGWAAIGILDWMMPRCKGFDICRAVRAAAREPYVYILLLTARCRFP